MPFVIPIIAVAASVAASSAAAASIGAITIAGIAISASTVGAIVGGLAALAVTFIGTAIIGGGSNPANNSGSAGNRSQQIRDPISPHQIILGTVKVSGTLAYIYVPSNPRPGYESAIFGYAARNFQANALLYNAVVIAGHEVASIRDISLNGILATDPQYYGYAHVESTPGTPGQTANAMLVRETDGGWTDNHKLSGRAVLYGAYYFSVDPAAPFSAVPNINAIVDGARCYDPRTGQTAFSTNPALLIAWYLQQPFGMRCDAEEIDTATLIAAANICDEPIELLTGVTEARYTCNGSFTLDQSPASILDNIKACMDGGVVFSGGIWFIFAGATVAPSFTITQDMLRGPVTVQANRAAKDSFNAVRATYVRPEGNWQATDAPVRYDQVAVVSDGATFYQALDFPFTTSGYTVQRLMQIALRRNRSERSITLQLNMTGLCIRPWDVVTFSTPRLPAANYRVTSWTLVDTGVDVLLEAEPDDIYAWDPATDELELLEQGLGNIPGAYTLAAPSFTVSEPDASGLVAVAVQQVVNSTDAEVQYITGDNPLWQAAPRGCFTVTVRSYGAISFRVRARNDVQLSAWNSTPTS